MAILLFGQKVRVINGFYKGCIGTVIEEGVEEYTVELSKLCQDLIYRQVTVAISARYLETLP